MKEIILFPWKSEYDELAAYNKRLMQGIVHTKKYKKEMAKLQKEFDEDYKKYEQKNKDGIKSIII